ncbi:MAG: hypothetical protein WAK48_07470 [Candidatus Acidiferrum sp.]|jgi:hypothetical protein
METTVAMSAKQNTTGFNSARRSFVGRLILRMGLGGLALLLWQASSVKAQECCPDQPTQAELASFENASKKPVKMDATKMQQGDSATSVKISVATGANAAGNKKLKVHAKPPAIKETVQGVETAIPTTGKPPQKVEAVSDGKIQKKADS